MIFGQAVGTLTQLPLLSRPHLFAGRDIYHVLSREKIEQMQRASALPNPLPPYRHTIFDYLFAYILWWCIPATLVCIWFFSMLGLGSRVGDKTRSA
jgi:hypothetical protein